MLLFQIVHDDRATAAPLAFIVAGALIIGVIATALLTTNDIATPSNTGSSVAANRQAQAEGMLDLLITSSSDQTHRLGLAAPGSSHLAITMFRSLQKTAFTEDDTSLRYYQDELARLGVVECNPQGHCWNTRDFHLRAYPTLKSVQEKLNTAKDDHLRVAYIGHSQTVFAGGAPEVSAFQCKASTRDDDSVHYSLRVKNTGTAPTQFQVVMAIDNGGSAKITVRDQSGIVAAGTDQAVHLHVPNTAAAKCAADTKYTLSIYGTSRRLVHEQGTPTIVAPAPAAVAEGIPILLPAMHTVAGQPITVEYTADKDDVLDWKLFVQDASGLAGDCGVLAECKGQVIVPNKGSSFTITAPNDAVPTRYILEVKHQQHGATATQNVLVVPTADTVGPFEEQAGSSTFGFDEAMSIEVSYIHRLMGQFDPSLHDDSGDAGAAEWAGQCKSDPCSAWEGSGGDVFWDEKKVLTNNMPDRIKYADADACVPQDPDTIPHIVVVGSNVDHNAMTSGNFKIPLREWVVCGGLLIVYGSPAASTQWLQPIFHVGAQSTTGGISTPDSSHPVLRVPNQLDYPSYDHRDRTWRYTANAEDYFTNIVNQDNAPITALSDPGDFGKGTVLISSWLPYDLFGTGADADAEGPGIHLMDNFLTQAYRDLFLDYGPPIPTGQPVIPALRHSQIELSAAHDEPNYHPACVAGLCHIEMTVLLFLW